MKNANPKYYLAIVHTHEHDKDLTEYALHTKSKAKAFAAAAIKAMKTENVYAWLVLSRNGKGNMNGAEYTPIAFFLPSGAMNEVGDPEWKLPKLKKLIYVR